MAAPIAVHKDVRMDVEVAAKAVPGVVLGVVLGVRDVEQNAVVVARLHVLGVGALAILAALAVELSAAMDVLWIAVDVLAVVLLVKRIAQVVALYVRQHAVVAQVVLGVVAHVHQIVAVAVELARDAKRVVVVQVVVTDVELGAILDVQAHVKNLALVNVSAHVFRRVPDNQPLKF